MGGILVHTKTCMWAGLTLVAMATKFGLGTESFAYRLVAFIFAGVFNSMC